MEQPLTPLQLRTESPLLTKAELRQWLKVSDMWIRMRVDDDPEFSRRCVIDIATPDSSREHSASRPAPSPSTSGSPSTPPRSSPPPHNAASPHYRALTHRQQGPRGPRAARSTPHHSEEKRQIGAYIIHHSRA
ncbi:hypothetical protein ACFQ51_52315 [Streptomyces kaempferi]